MAFDSWTGGAGNLERLVPALREKGYDIFLLHIGSWGHDKERAVEEHIGELMVRDICYYDGMSIQDILRRERPQAVLFLSMQAYAHRAVNRYCKALGIPTVHLYHGVVGVQDTSAKRLNPVSVRRQVSLIASRLTRNVLRVWPLYWRALWNTGASLQDWVWFVRDVWRQVTARAYSGPAAPDTATSVCMVYTRADIAHAVERYWMTEESVFEVGNPDLMKFGLRQEDLGSCLDANRSPGNELVYIDNALLEVGAVFSSSDDFIHHLRCTQDAVAAQGFRFSVKLHPVHYQTGIASEVRAAGIDVCSDDEFLNKLKRAAGAIVEPSSAALLPCLLGLPVLLARYGKLSGQNYGAILMDYPLARQIYEIEEVKGSLQRIDVCSSIDRKLQDWLINNAGPMPANHMPERVADVIQSLTHAQ